MFNYYNNYNIANKGIDVLGSMYNSMSLNNSYGLDDKSSKQLNTASLLNSLMRTGSSIFDSYWQNQENKADQRDRYYDSFINNNINYSKGGKVKKTKRKYEKGGKVMEQMLPIYDNYQPTINSNGSDIMSLFTGGYSKQLGTKRKYRNDEVIYSTDHPRKTNSDIVHPGHAHMQKHVYKTDSYMDFDTYRKQRGGYSYKIQNYKKLKKWK